ncbi:MAG: hypothetical protein GEEBNDBF_01948 [bacterium]|nr:hypothetical protein [bacterium]
MRAGDVMPHGHGNHRATSLIGRLALLVLGWLSCCWFAPSEAGTGDFALPGYGDPQFLPLPSGGQTGQFAFESDPTTPTDLHWFPGTSTLQRLVSTGGLRLSWRRGEQGVQAVADSLIYERDSAAPDAPERFTLIGNVAVVTPQGGVRSSALTLEVQQDTVLLSARGGVLAQFGQQWIRAAQAELQYQTLVPAGMAPAELTHQGHVAGDVRIEFALDPGAAELQERVNPLHGPRPFFEGVDLAPQQVEIIGPRFDFTYRTTGLNSVAADAPSVLTLLRRGGSDSDEEPLRMSLAAPIFEATFESTEVTNGDASGTRLTSLRTFEAPVGLVVSYLEGTIQAGQGALDLAPDRQSLTLSGGVRAEQGGALMFAADLGLWFDAEGQIRLEASGRPTFLFESSRFAPLASILGKIRPGGSQQW